VFLFNVLEGMLAPVDEEKDVVEGDKMTTRRRGLASALLKPKQWKEKLQRMALAKLFDPRRVAGHMIAHRIFDGDGIFLHKQGNRMKEAALTYRDYSTPSSADVLLNSYRRFLDAAAKQTLATASADSDHDRQVTAKLAATAVVASEEAYGDDASLSEMLDRYNTQPVFCPTCSAALRQTRKTKARLTVLKTALQGATASTFLSFAAPLLFWDRLPFRLALLASLTTASGVALLSSFLAHRWEKKLDRKINSFLFEDYIHAEKN
jgi:hypothetical protein